MSRSFSDDAIFHGRLSLRQHQRGYRFSEDAVLLAAFAARGEPKNIAVDFGAGCGIVGLILLLRRYVKVTVALEIQKGLSGLCRENARINGLDGPSSTIRADLRSAPIASRSVDLVVCNPPYMPLGQGHLPPDPEKALARHELCCVPEALASEAARCLTPDGKLALVYPYQRLEQVLSAVKDVGLDPVRIRRVHPGPERDPVLFLLEASFTHGESDLVEERPMITRDDWGRPTSEMVALLGGRDA